MNKLEQIRQQIELLQVELDMLNESNKYKNVSLVFHDRPLHQTHYAKPVAIHNDRDRVTVVNTLILIKKTRLFNLQVELEYEKAQAKNEHTSS